MDYKLLLKKYISHVGEDEGVSFIDTIIVGFEYSNYPITQEELEELKRLDAEILSENAAKQKEAQ